MADGKGYPGFKGEPKSGSHGVEKGAKPAQNPPLPNLCKSPSMKKGK